MEERKFDFKSLVSAGKRVIARIKNQSSGGKIIAYDGADCFYSDSSEYGDIDIIPEGYALPKPSAKEKFQSFVSGIAKRKSEYEDDSDLTITEFETDEEYSNTEETVSHYQKIMSKLDTLKDKGNDTLNEFMKKADNLFKSGTLTKHQLSEELDNLMIELDDKLGVIISKSENAASAIEELTSQSKSNFDNLSSSLSAVSDKSDEMLATLLEVGNVLKKSEAKIDEIHEASMGIDKLVDSVFELKNTSLQASIDIADIKKKQKFIKIWSIIAASVISAIAIASLTLQILNMLI